MTEIEKLSVEQIEKKFLQAILIVAGTIAKNRAKQNETPEEMQAEDEYVYKLINHMIMGGGIVANLSGNNDLHNKLFVTGMMIKTLGLQKTIYALNYSDILGDKKEERVPKILHIKYVQEELFLIEFDSIPNKHYCVDLKEAINEYKAYKSIRYDSTKLRDVKIIRHGSAIMWGPLEDEDEPYCIDMSAGGIYSIFKKSSQPWMYIASDGKWYFEVTGMMEYGPYDNFNKCYAAKLEWNNTEGI